VDCQLDEQEQFHLIFMVKNSHKSHAWDPEMDKKKMRTKFAVISEVLIFFLLYFISPDFMVGASKIKCLGFISLKGVPYDGEFVKTSQIALCEKSLCVFAIAVLRNRQF